MSLYVGSPDGPAASAGERQISDNMIGSVNSSTNEEHLTSREAYEGIYAAYDPARNQGGSSSSRSPGGGSGDRAAAFEQMYNRAGGAGAGSKPPSSQGSEARREAGKF